MPVVYEIQAIPAKHIKVDQIRLELLNELRKQGREIRKDLKQVVSTWQNKPDFTDPNISLAGGDAVVMIEPTGNEDAVKHFKFLDEGTSIRWAVMSRNWRSKTKVRVLQSGAGAGRAVIWGKRAMLRRGIAPRPGIKARHWTQTITARRLGPFEAGMRDSIRRGAEKAY